MSKGDKEFQWRMEGMNYALKLVREGGVEALEKDMKTRNILKVPMKFSAEELEGFYLQMSSRIYNNMLTMTYAVLHDMFGFRKKRLQKFKKHLDEKTLLVSDLTGFGNHYATFEDYAVEANKKYDLGINIDLVSASADAKDELLGKRVKLDAILDLLEKNQYTDASEFLKNHEYLSK